MKRSVMFIINAVITILFGLGFVVIPATVLSFYGVTLPDAGLFIARLFGSAFITFAVISWLVRNAPEGSNEVRGVMLGLLVGDLLGFAFSLYYQLQGVPNGLGWTTVALYLLIGLGFVYYYVSEPAK